MSARAVVVGAVATAAAFAALALAASDANAQEHPGKVVYDRWCAECHGVDGTGVTPSSAYMLPRPRDFTEARYQIRTTPSGGLPTDADILRVIEQGMPGTAMPGWPKLSRTDKTNLVAYLKTFSRFFESEGAPQAISVGRATRASADAIAEGRDLYDQLECWRCHGRAGRGDGVSAPTQSDDKGMPIRPADLTQNWRFNGGGTVEDIHMRLRTGLDGTPMPSSSDLIEANVVTAEQLWNVAHYVRSLSPANAPEPREIVRAVLRAGALPTTPDDDAWEDVPASYIPLVGQIIEPPRWFAPTVSTVWVQAMHNGEELAIRLVWNDPSRSPDPAWEEWRERIADVMEPKEASPAEGPLPDAVAVQFPVSAITGRDLPYFLMGDARTPVHLWQWNSDRGVAEMTARGLDVLEPLPAVAGSASGNAAWSEGQWQLVLRRVLTSETEPRPAFATGEPIPISFQAWDGSNGESGKRASISSWYFLYLEQPATAAIYVVPILTILITALLGFAAVRYAQSARRQEVPAPVAGVALAEP